MRPDEVWNQSAKSLIFIEIEKVQDPVSAVEQQNATAIDDPIQVVGQPGEFFDACHGQRVNLALKFGRQGLTSANLPIGTWWQFGTFRGAIRKSRGILVYTFSDNSTIA